ncbi:hypothetical protein ACHAQA_006928 [Verticillium albo-atrum]
MHITKSAVAFLALSTGALSYKIRIFSSLDCSAGGGAAQDINVEDNTCRWNDNLHVNARSFRVLAYGAHRQRAEFYDSGCFPGTSAVINTFWADGGSDSFKKDRCINLSRVARAYGSWSR